MGGHYIEVEVWSSEKQKEPLPVPYQFRDVLTIPTYEYQGKSPNNVTHPDVLDFTLVNGVGGTRAIPRLRIRAFSGQMTERSGRRREFPTR